MDPRVPRALVTAREAAATHVARERFLSGMRALVGGQVVGPAERSTARDAAERLLSRVNAQVAGQLVATGKPPVTAGRRAGERTLVDRDWGTPAAYRPRRRRRRPRLPTPADNGSADDELCLDAGRHVHRLHLDSGKLVVDLGGGGRRRRGRLDQRLGRPGHLHQAEIQIHVAQVDRRRRRRRISRRRPVAVGRGRR